MGCNGDYLGYIVASKSPFRRKRERIQAVLIPSRILCADICAEELHHIRWRRGNGGVVGGSWRRLLRARIIKFGALQMPRWKTI